MARTAKTNHVMSLVGEKSGKSEGEKAAKKQKTGEKTPARAFNPALLPIEEELRSGKRNITPANPILRQNNTYTDGNRDSSESSLEKNEELANRNERACPSNGTRTDEELTEQIKGHFSDDESSQQPKEIFQKDKYIEKKENKRITAIVPDLINQELEAIVDRFKIEPTDSNLWQLTKAALETIRPEFALNEQEYEEKCSKLRQKVILEMTKAAIRISKAHRNK